MRRFLKEPIPEIFCIWDDMSAAVDAHLSGNNTQAARHFRLADSPIVWEWLNSSWTGITQHVVDLNPKGDTRIIPKAERDPDKRISREIRSAVLQRDGFRCRYCGIPVVHADIRKIAVALYPDAVVWDSRDPKMQHAGFQCLWLQFDHVEPHCRGGKSTVDNVVVSCALCNFGKDKHTLRQLNLEDPRLRAPDPMDYDGLERFRSCALKSKTMLPRPTSSLG